ncbi:hypothetical protein RYX36_011356 [Vicia faba]
MNSSCGMPSVDARNSKVVVLKVETPLVCVVASVDTFRSKSAGCGDATVTLYVKLQVRN